MNKKSYILLSILISLCFFSTFKAATPGRGVLANIGNPATMIQEIKPEQKPLPAPATTAINAIQPVTSGTSVPVSTPTPVSTAPTPQQKPTETSQTTAVISNELTLPVPPSVDSTALTTKPTEPAAAPETQESTTLSTQNASVDQKNPSEPATPTEQEKKSDDTDKELAEQLLEQQQDDQLVRFYFEDATLENLVHYIEDLYKIKFFADDDITPTPQGGGVLKGHKITFKTNKPLTRDQAWNLFLKFLDMAGLSVIPAETEGFYRITTPTIANKEVLPTYFDTSLDDIPDNSLKVRYVFFLKNAPLATIQKLVATFASSTAAPVQTFPDLNALIVVDKGSNIRSLMKIVQEFDKDMPEAMVILKLKRADAQEVATLYQNLTKTEAPQGVARFLTQRNQPSSLYFPANVRIIPEPRTNALILLGARKELNKIEEFIVKHIDVELDMPYSPLHIYELQHTLASNISTILNNTVTKFGSGTVVGQYGGVRDGNQFFGPVNITPDTVGNRLVIRAEENDYLKLKEIIQKLDVVQPQVIIEVLIVDVQTTDSKILGSQFRNKENGLVKNVDFQRSGLPNSNGFSSVVNATDGSLLGNLIALASSGAQSTGATLLSVGKQASGVWAIFNMLQSTAKTDILSNPFLLTTNNFTANVSLGSTRQVRTTTVNTGGQTVGGDTTMTAALDVTITPQISSDGSVQMSISITIKDFTSSNLATGDTITKEVKTSAIVGNREVLVLGGVIKDKITHNLNKVPVLGSIPVLGWFFKSKTKEYFKSNVLIFISPQIIYPGMEKTMNQYMNTRAERAKSPLEHAGASDMAARKDPINRFFFDDRKAEGVDIIDSFTSQDSYEESKHNADRTIRKKKSSKKKVEITEEPVAKKVRKRRGRL